MCFTEQSGTGFQALIKDGQSGMLDLGSKPRTTGWELEILMRENGANYMAHDSVTSLASILESRFGWVPQRELHASCLEFTGSSPQRIGTSVNCLLAEQLKMVNSILSLHDRYGIVATGIGPGFTLDDFAKGYLSPWIVKHPRYEFFHAIYKRHFNPNIPLPLQERSLQTLSGTSAFCASHFHIRINWSEIALFINISRWVNSIIKALFVSSPHNLGKLSSDTEELRSACWYATYQERTQLRNSWYKSPADYFQWLISKPNLLDNPGSQNGNSSDTEEVIDRLMPWVRSASPLALMKLHSGTVWSPERINFHLGEGDTLEGAALTLETRPFSSGNPYQNQMTFALWLGLMLALSERFKDNGAFIKWAGRYSDTKANDKAVCKRGLEALVVYCGKKCLVGDVLKELIPIARVALLGNGESTEPLDQLTHLLDIKWTPARWIRENWGKDGSDLAELLAKRILTHPTNW